MVQYQSLQLILVHSLVCSLHDVKAVIYHLGQNILLLQKLHVIRDIFCGHSTSNAHGSGLIGQHLLCGRRHEPAET